MPADWTTGEVGARVGGAMMLGFVSFVSEEVTAGQTHYCSEDGGMLCIVR